MPSLGLVPPPERGRSVREAGRVGVTLSRFNRTPGKTTKARNLRRASTDVEARLWSKLRDGRLGGHIFRRQHPAGNYILDFYAPALRLAIELDGGQHTDMAHAIRDQHRDAWLSDRAVKIRRFWNSEVIENLNGVLEVISASADERKALAMTPTRRWRADLPLSGRGAYHTPRDGDEV